MKASQSEGKEFEKAPQGNHVAICCKLIDLGTQHDERYNKWRHTIKIAFELPNAKMTEGEFAGKPFLVWSAPYNLSFGSDTHPTNLRNDLESWRGRAFTSEELEGFDMKNLMGKPCLVNIVHTEDGKYANIRGITPMPQGMPLPAATVDTVYFSLDSEEFDGETFDGLSEGFQEIIKKSREWEDMHAEPVSDPAPESAPQPEDVPPIDDDNLPF